MNKFPSKLLWTRIEAATFNTGLPQEGVPRVVRQHLWRGGHHPEMVKQGLQVELAEAAASEPGGGCVVFPGRRKAPHTDWP